MASATNTDQDAASAIGGKNEPSKARIARRTALEREYPLLQQPGMHTRLESLYHTLTCMSADETVKLSRDDAHRMVSDGEALLGALRRMLEAVRHDLSASEAARDDVIIDRLEDSRG